MAIFIPQGLYRTVKQTARAWEMSEQTVVKAIKENRIAGTVKAGVNYLIPINAVITIKKRGR